MLHGLPLQYLYRTPAGGDAHGLGPCGLAILGSRGPFPAGPRTLLLYDAAKKPHTSISCATEDVSLVPPAPGSGYVTVQEGAGGTSWSLLLRDPASEWEPLAKAFLCARATAAAHAAAAGGSGDGAAGPPRVGVLIQDIALGDGGAARDDVAAAGDVCEVSYTMRMPPLDASAAGGEEANTDWWETPSSGPARAIVALGSTGPHASPRGLAEGLAGCAAGGRRLVVVPGSAVCAGPELLSVGGHGAHGLLVYDVTLHSARAKLTAVPQQQQVDAQAAAMQAAMQVPPPPPPPAPATPVEDPRHALAERMGRLAAQTGAPAPMLPALPVSRPSSPVQGLAPRQLPTLFASAPVAPSPQASAPEQPRVDVQQGGNNVDVSQPRQDLSHSMHEVTMMQTQSGQRPHAYVPGTPAPMPSAAPNSPHASAHAGGAAQHGSSPNVSGGMAHPAMPGASWATTPPGAAMGNPPGQYFMAPPSHGTMDQHGSLFAGGPSPYVSPQPPSAVMWPHGMAMASPTGYLYPPPPVGVPMQMHMPPLAGQQWPFAPHIMPPAWHPHTGSGLSGVSADRGFYAGAQSDAMSRLNVATEHLARSLAAVMTAPWTGAAGSAPGLPLTPPVDTVPSPALTTASARVARTLAERDAADAQRKAIAAERDAAEDARDKALAEVLHVRAQLSQAQHKAESLQHELDMAVAAHGDRAAQDVAAALEAARKEMQGRLEEELASAARAWEAEKQRIRAAWERQVAELREEADALRAKLVEVEAAQHTQDAVHVPPVRAEDTPPQEAMPAPAQPEGVQQTVAVNAVPPAACEEHPPTMDTEPDVAQSAEVHDDAPVAVESAVIHVEEVEASASGAHPRDAESEVMAVEAAPTVDTPAEAPEVAEAAPPPAPEVEQAAPADGAALAPPSRAINGASGPKQTQRPRGAGGRRPPSGAPAAQSNGQPRKKTFLDSDDDDEEDVQAAKPMGVPLPPPPARPAAPGEDEDEDDGW